MTLEAYNGGTLLTSFPATASAEGVTYVSFPAPITKDSNVTNVIIASISSPNPNNKVLYLTGSFTNCNPTTPAPTTAAPTPNPTTPSPTPNPTTAAPTPNPTTAAPTPNPTAPFSAIVSYSTISANDACTNPQGSFAMTGNSGTFCLSSTYTATNWTSLGTGTYWLSYDGQVRQHKNFDAYSALAYTMQARPNSQGFFISNAGDHQSVVLNNLRQRALEKIEKDTQDDINFMEWSAAPHRKLNDIEGWKEANP